jgi:hypothetical protein
VLTDSGENQLNIFERKILRKIYEPTQNPDGSWRIKTNEELRHKMKEEDIVKFIKSQRLRWAGHVMRMEKTRTTRKITEWTLYNTRPVGKPRLRWMDQVEEDLKRMKITGWRVKAEGRQEWVELLNRPRPTQGCRVNRRRRRRRRRRRKRKKRRRSLILHT